MCSDKDQSERFKAKARELECDESEDAFNATLRKIAKAPKADEKDDDAKK